ncbi:MAG TPA: response regulator [Holophagaceae bacterium]|nr:response regulator [Holophagaceae bacterium]
MEKFFPIFTIAIYLALTVVWGAILFLYLRMRRAGRMDALVATLVGVLALDAFKAFVESLYFGLLWGSNYGILPAPISRALSLPLPLSVPKVLNLAVAVIVLMVLIRKWIPDELAERSRLQKDLTAALEASRAGESRLKRVVDALAEYAVFMAVEAGVARIDRVNTAFREAMGLSAGESSRHPIRELLPAGLAGCLEAAALKASQTGSPVAAEVEVTLSAGLRSLQFMVVPLAPEPGLSGLTTAVGRDVTDERKVEQDRMASQKLESLGLLAGGVAHDFNNLLTAMLGNLNLAQARMPGDSPIAAHLENMETSLVRAAGLTRQLLAYSGKGRFVVTAVDLSRSVREIGQLLAASIPKKLHVAYHLDEGLPPVVADAGQIQQVVMNLVTNAAEAIGDRDGTIRISTGLQRIDATYIRSTFHGQTLEPGDFVTLEVSDDGAGMTPDVRARIFDPFFTTKASGRGLGLSAMLGILRGHRGGLKVYSEPGRGTTFKLFFPAGEGQAGPDHAPQSGQSPSFSGLALVVDDEPLIREAVQQMLRMMGFTTLEAEDGREALDAMAKHPDGIRLVVMDLTMPGMDGREAYRRMAVEHPEARVILSSGYNEQDAVQAFLGKGLAGFIQKPYRMAELAEAVAKALG